MLEMFGASVWVKSLHLCPVNDTFFIGLDLDLLMYSVTQYNGVVKQGVSLTGIPDNETNHNRELLAAVKSSLGAANFWTWHLLTGKL